MNITISFKNLEHTESLDERIKEKTSKLEKLFNGRVDIKWTCWVKEGGHHAEVKINGPHFNYHASAVSDSLYKTIDLALNKTQKQITKKKERWKNQIHDSKELEIMDPESAWLDHNEDDIAA